MHSLKKSLESVTGNGRKTPEAPPHAVTAWHRAATRVCQVVCVIMAIGLLLGVTSAFADNEEDTLLVWAGDAAHVAPDFVAVIDFDRDSPSYGKVLRIVPLTGRNAIGNEPHHVGISNDGRTVALGGLLSVLRGQDQVFFFDVTDPRHPAFIRSNNPPQASITDEFAALSSGGFLVTFMGGGNGANPGRVVEYDAKQNVVQAWPTNPPTDGFNPHGLAIDEAHNLMVTSDFVCPAHTLLIPGGGGAVMRGSIRVWDLARRAVTRTIAVGTPTQPAGTMDVQLIPRDQRLRAFTAGMADNNLYLIDTKKGSAKAVFNFSALAVGNAPPMPSLLRINKQGTRLFITVNGAGKVAMLDISSPEKPKVLSVVDLGPGSGPHFLRLTGDEKRLIVTDYFLVEDLAPPGVVNADGDHKVHVIDVQGNRLELDARFDLDFNRDISTGPARPHGVIPLPFIATPVDVSFQVRVTRGGFRFDRASGRFVQSVTLTNTGTSPITGPISLALDSLSPNAALYNQTGLTSATIPTGRPYLVVRSKDLAAEASASALFEFTAPTDAAIKYTTCVLAGPGTR
jgi:selenium-binding protein 1